MPKILIFCLSNSSLYTEIWTNKQHLMTRLAKRPGYKVWFIDQGLSRREILRALKTLNIKYFLFPIHRWQKNLTNVSFYFIPLIVGGALRNISWRIIRLFINIISLFYPKHKKILWIYEPQAGFLFKSGAFKNYFVLYDCVDDFKSQPFYSKYPRRLETLRNLENEVILNSNLVTTTSKALYEKIKPINDKTFHIHNVGDFEHFLKESGEISNRTHSSILESNKPIVTYAGVIDDYKLDLNLIHSVTSHLLNFNFVFVGPVRISNDKTTLDKIRVKKNVYFMGKIDYSILPSYLHKSDIIWLPYSRNEHTKHVFPIKLFEGMATGKYIVARNLESYQEYWQYLKIFKDFKEAIYQIKAYNEDTNMEMQSRIQVAKNNNWENRLDLIINSITKCNM